MPSEARLWCVDPEDEPHFRRAGPCAPGLKWTLCPTHRLWQTRLDPSRHVVTILVGLGGSYSPLFKALILLSKICVFIPKFCTFLTKILKVPKLHPIVPKFYRDFISDTHSTVASHLDSLISRNSIFSRTHYLVWYFNTS